MFFLLDLNRFPELSRTISLFQRLSSPGKCHNKNPGLFRFSWTRMNAVTRGKKIPGILPLFLWYRSWNCVHSTWHIWSTIQISSQHSSHQGQRQNDKDDNACYSNLHGVNKEKIKHKNQEATTLTRTLTHFFKRGYLWIQEQIDIDSGHQPKVEYFLGPVARRSQKFSHPESHTPVAKSLTLRLQSCFIHIFLIYRGSEISGVYTSPLLDTDELNLALRPEKLPGLPRSSPKVNDWFYGTCEGKAFAKESHQPYV